MNYTIRVKKKTKTLEAGHKWAESLPDSLFAKKFHFDGHDFGPFGRESPKMKTYTLFWFPKTLKSANELIVLMDKHKMGATLQLRRSDL